VSWYPRSEDPDLGHPSLVREPAVSDLVS